MPIIFDRYEPDHSAKGIGGFLLSDQLRDAVKGGAGDVAAIANRTGVSKLRGGYYVESGPDVIVTKNGNPRLSERVRHDDRAAAAIEFGSGSGSRSTERTRPQGGSSQPFRTLGKAGAEVADRIGGDDD